MQYIRDNICIQVYFMLFLHNVAKQMLDVIIIKQNNSKTVNSDLCHKDQVCVVVEKDAAAAE